MELSLILVASRCIPCGCFLQAPNKHTNTSIDIYFFFHDIILFINLVEEFSSSTIYFRSVMHPVYNLLIVKNQVLYRSNCNFYHARNARRFYNYQRIRN